MAHLCAKCASTRKKTCCQCREIYVTLGDVQRVARRTRTFDFFTFDECCDPAYLDDGSDPVWTKGVFKPDGRRRILKKDEIGNCVFLGTAGCRLDMETRPLICRLFPFDFNACGLFPEPVAGECPVELLEPGQDLLGALQMNKAEAERWRTMLYSELTLEKTDLEYWTNHRYGT